MKRVLTNTQLDKLSDLSLGLGQLFFASTVIPYVIPISTIDRPSAAVLVFGIVLSLILWIFGVWIVRGVKK